MKYSFAVVFLVLLFSSCTDDPEYSLLDNVNTEGTNQFYINNRAPLKPNALIKLPVGSIEPHGWLKEIMLRQKNGLAGHLGEISAWLQKEDNAWLSKDGRGSWGWEEVPYWLKGYANMGYILNDREIIEEARIWIEGALQSQRDNGDFGPYIEHWNKRKQDFWGNMIMMYCLQSYYEYSADERVLELMTDYFKYQLSVADEDFLDETTYWPWLRAGDNLHSVFWLYNRTGEEFLLDLAKKIDHNMADWRRHDYQLDDLVPWISCREGMEFPEWYGKLIDWHNVNVAQSFRAPAQYSLLSHDEKDLDASYEVFDIVRKYFGQVPGGMFGGDEICRPGYSDPRQAIETCGIVEQMNSDEHMLRITGDTKWADHAEELAFNTYPAAMMPDMKSLRYLTAPNMVLSDDLNHHPGIMNEGPFLLMNPFSSRCCQHNHTQGWPYFTENLWMATPDNGLAAVLYASSSVKAKVGEGQEVVIKNSTNYPFEDTMHFEIETSNDVDFPLYFRLPGWCKTGSLSLNGEVSTFNAEDAAYLCIRRKWENRDRLEIVFHKELALTRWDGNKNSLSVSYGPISFSLKIDEEYIRVESDKTAIFDSKWQKGADASAWPSYEIRPKSSWNYALFLSSEDVADMFTIENLPWPEDNYPFTVNSVPLRLKARGKKVPAWTLDEYQLTGELPVSPVKSDELIEEIELIPMGAARLRISAFPWVEE